MTASGRLLVLGAGTLLLAACGFPAASPAPVAVPRAEDGAASPVVDDRGPDGEDEGTVPCVSPAGFRVDHPADWSVNPVGTLPACSWFAPEPFVVPEASDVRTAPITVEVLPVPFAEASAPTGEERARSVLEVDGRKAVRTELVTHFGLYPVGTAITSYAVDLGGQTLIAEAVGLPPFEHERDVAVLDAMIRSLDLDGAGLT